MTRKRTVRPVVVEAPAPALAPIVALDGATIQIARLQDVVGREKRVHHAGGWSGLRAAIATSPPDTLFVVQPYREGSFELSSELRSLLHDYPSASFVVAMPGGRGIRPTVGGLGADLATLGEWGVAHVLYLDYDTTVFTIRQQLIRASDRLVRFVILRRITAPLGAQARVLVTTALETARAGAGATGFASALGVSDRTLRRRTEELGLPAPRPLLRWMRLLLSARLLDDPGRTVLDAALPGGYGSDIALQRAFRLCGLPSPGSIPKGKALDTAIAAFLRAVAPPRRP